jgi:hypothetical protein
MDLDIFKCTNDRTMKGVVEKGKASNLPAHICKGEWVYETSLTLTDTDSTLPNGASPKEILTDIKENNYHIGNYEIISTGFGKQ